jgi:hypothetical protein
MVRTFPFDIALHFALHLIRFIVCGKNNGNRFANVLSSFSVEALSESRSFPNGERKRVPLHCGHYFSQQGVL